MRRLAAVLVFLALTGPAAAQSLGPLVPAMPVLKRQATHLAVVRQR